MLQSRYSYNPAEMPQGVPNPEAETVELYPSYWAGASDYCSRPYWDWGASYVRQPLDVVENGLAGCGYDGPFPIYPDPAAIDGPLPHWMGDIGESPTASGVVMGLGLSSLLMVAPLIGAGIGALAAKAAADTDGSEADKMKTGAWVGGLIGGMAIFMLGFFAAGGGAVSQALQENGTET